MSLFKGSISGNRVARKLVIGAGWGGWGRIRGLGQVGRGEVGGGLGGSPMPCKWEFGGEKDSKTLSGWML